MAEKKYATDFLFASSSLLVGMGSIFNVPGNYFEYNYSKSDDEADTKAIESDWGMIGQDIIESASSNSTKQLQFSFD